MNDSNQTTAPTTDFSSRARVFFDPCWYRQAYGIDGEDDAVFSHFLETGLRDDLQPSPLFDVDWYRRCYPDELKSSCMGAFAHYVVYGDVADLSPCILFDPRWYRLLHPNISFRDITAARHFAANRALKASPLFDREWYIARYQHLLRDQPDPYVHFIVEGNAADLSPHPIFDVAFYRRTNDVPKGESAISHFLRLGWKDGRDPGPSFGMEDYELRNPDVKAEKMNPLLHYLALGRFEGRPSSPSYIG